MRAQIWAWAQGLRPRPVAALVHLEPGNEWRVPDGVVAPDLVNHLLHVDVVAEIQTVDPRVDGHQADERVGLALHVDGHTLARERLPPE